MLPKISIKNIQTVLTSLKKEDGTALVTPEEANNLVALKFSNKEPILTLEDRSFLIEVAWLLAHPNVGYEKTRNFLSTNWEKVFGTLHNIRTKMLFENPLLEPARDKFALDMEIFRNKTDVVVGGENCPRCGSQETISSERQLRACDEMSTLKCYCLSCTLRWTAH